MSVIFTPSTTVYHPDVQPYISTSDYTSAPTAVDTTALIPGGSVAQNLMALAIEIRSASSWANNICDQILAATLDTQMASGLLVRRDGTVRAVCDFWPVLELDSFSAGSTPSTLAAVSQTSDIWLKGRKVLVVPVSGLSGPSNQFTWPGPLLPGDRVYAQWSYWNGWPHSTLAHAVAVTDTSVVVANTMPAALAGRVMTIWDGVSTEQITIASTFTGGTTLPIVGNPQFAHTLQTAPASTMVSTFADDIRKAVTCLTSALIKTRGAEAYEMDAIGQEPSKSALIEGGGMEDLSIAVDLLSFYRRAS